MSSKSNINTPPNKSHNLQISEVHQKISEMLIHESTDVYEEEEIIITELRMARLALTITGPCKKKLIVLQTSGNLCYFKLGIASILEYPHTKYIYIGVS